MNSAWCRCAPLALGLLALRARLRQPPHHGARQPARHRRLGGARLRELGRQFAKQRVQPRRPRIVRRKVQHARRGEQRAKRLAHRLELTLHQKARTQRQHQAVGVRREAKAVHHARRHHDGGRPLHRLAPFVQHHLGRALLHPQHLVQAVVHVRLDLPVVEPAARLHFLDVQHLLPGRGGLAVEGKAADGTLRLRGVAEVRLRVGGFHDAAILIEKYKIYPHFVQCLPAPRRPKVQSRHQPPETKPCSFRPLLARHRRGPVPLLQDACATSTPASGAPRRRCGCSRATPTSSRPARTGRPTPRPAAT